jgi:hypothetical protein
LLIAWLQQGAVAGPQDPDTPANDHHDPGAAVTPWIDLAPSRVLEPAVEPAVPDHKVTAATTLAALYAGFATWTYFAWYRHHKPLSEFKIGGDGWLGSRTYWGGFSKPVSTIVGVGLSELLFFFVEVKDGFYYEFSLSDLTGDTAGALLALAFETWPRLDEMFDYRVEYWPSHEYIAQARTGNVNIAEDYSGETYLLAYHLGSIHALRDSRWGLWSQFVDVTLGFGTRGYKPDPPTRMEPDYLHRQEMFIGLAVNAQGVCDWLFDGRSKRAKKLFHGLFEVLAPPGGSLPLLEYRHIPTGQVMTGGA